MPVNDDIMTEAVSRAVLNERLKVKEAKGVGDYILNTLNPSIKKAIVEAAQKPQDVNSRITKARLEQLRRKLEKVISKDMDAFLDNFTDTLEEFAVTEAQEEVEDVNSAIPLDIRDNGVELSQLSEAAVSRTVRDLVVNGETLASTVEGFGVKFSRDISRAFGTGLAAGESIDKIVARVQAATDLNINSAKTLVRTSTNAIANAVREETYHNNEDIIKGVRWVSTLDLKTSTICQGLDGKVFPVGEGQRPPAHPNCRSTTVPVLKSWRELGIDKDDLEGGSRLSMDGKVPQGMNYEEWLSSRSTEEQNEALGKEKGVLFRKGELDLKKQNNRFGQPLTVEEIKEKNMKKRGATPADIAYAKQINKEIADRRKAKKITKPKESEKTKTEKLNEELAQAKIATAKAKRDLKAQQIKTEASQKKLDETIKSSKKAQEEEVRDLEKKLKKLKKPPKYIFDLDEKQLKQYNEIAPLIQQGKYEEFDEKIKILKREWGSDEDNAAEKDRQKKEADKLANEKKKAKEAKKKEVAAAKELKKEKNKNKNIKKLKYIQDLNPKQLQEYDKIAGLLQQGRFKEFDIKIKALRKKWEN